MTTDGDHFKEDVRDRLDCRDVLEANGIDRKPGRLKPWHPFRCLFHDDTNPSMNVSESGYSCKACGASGDVFGLIAALYDLDVGRDFAEVLSLGAKAAGMDARSNSVQSLENHRRASREREAQQRAREERQAERARDAAALRDEWNASLWDILEAAEIDDDARRWFERRGIDPGAAWRTGARSFAGRADDLMALRDDFTSRYTSDQLTGAGLMSATGRFWAPLSSHRSVGEGVAIPCTQPGQEAPFSWRWRRLDPNATPKTLQQPSGELDGWRGGILGLREAARARVVVVVEGEPDYLSACEELEGLEDVAVLGVCQTSGDLGAWLGQIAPGAELVVLAHHDRDKTTGERRRMDAHLTASDLEASARDFASRLAGALATITDAKGEAAPRVRQVVDVDGAHDLNDQHKAGELGWLRGLLTGEGVGEASDLTDEFSRRMFAHIGHASARQERSMDRREWLRTIGRPPTSTHDRLEDAWKAIAEHAAAAVMMDGVTVDASLCGLGKTHAYGRAILEAIRDGYLERVLWAVPTNELRDKAFAELQDRRRDLGIAAGEVDIREARARTRDSCAEYDGYRWRERAKMGAGTSFCNGACPHRRPDITGKPSCLWARSLGGQMGDQSAPLMVTTHDMARILLERGEEFDLIVWDEGATPSKLTLTTRDLDTLLTARDLSGEGVAEMRAMLEASAREASSRGRKPVVRGAELMAALNRIKVADVDDRKTGQDALEELNQDPSRMDAPVTDQGAVQALADLVGRAESLAHVADGVLYLPKTWAPPLDRAGRAIVLDASATKRGARALYGEHTWRRAEMINLHVRHIHIRTSGCSSIVRHDGSWDSERARLIALAIRAMFPNALHIQHKKWEREGSPMHIELAHPNERRTYHASSLARGSNVWSHLNEAVAWDWRVPAHALEARVAELEFHGAHATGALDLDAWVMLELMMLEQALGRVRPMNATAENPCVLVTVGSGDAPPLPYVESAEVVDGSELLRLVFNRPHAGTIGADVQALADQGDGLWIRREGLTVLCGLQRGAQTSLISIGDFVRPPAHSTIPMTYDESGDHEIRSLIEGSRWGLAELSHWIESTYQRDGLGDVTAVEIENSQGSPLRVVPPASGLTWARLRDLAEHVGASWFGVGSWRFERGPDGDWLTGEDVAAARRVHILGMLEGVAADARASELYERLASELGVCSRTARDRVAEAFGPEYTDALRAELASRRARLEDSPARAEAIKKSVKAQWGIMAEAVDESIRLAHAGVSTPSWANQILGAIRMRKDGESGWWAALRVALRSYRAAMRRKAATMPTPREKQAYREESERWRALQYQAPSCAREWWPDVGLWTARRRQGLCVVSWPRPDILSDLMDQPTTGYAVNVMRRRWPMRRALRAREVSSFHPLRTLGDYPRLFVDPGSAAQVWQS